MSNYNASRIKRIFAQQQASSAFATINNTTGVWSNTGAQLQRVDQGSLTLTRNAPYSRLPVLTGTTSEVAGVRGRKSATWDIKGMPFIPNGVAGSVPDCDIILQAAFGQAATGSGTKTYAFSNPPGSLPFTLLEFPHGSTSLTSRVAWGCVPTKLTWNFNAEFLTMDVTGAAGYIIDSTGFSIFDTNAKAGLTAWPLEPTSPTVNGQPITGFGTGYTATIDTQDLSLKVRVSTITFETGYTIVGDVYGSPYGIAIIPNTHTVSIALTALDDDSSALNDLKIKADTDNTTINATIVAGTVAGSIFTFNLNNIQLNAFDLKDDGAMVDVEIPESMAHASSIGAVDDFTIIAS